MRNLKSIIALLCVILITVSSIYINTNVKESDKGNIASESDFHLGLTERINGNSDNLTMDYLVEERVEIGDISSYPQGLSYYKGFLYFISSTNESMSVLVKFSPENNSVVDFIYINEQVDSLYFTNGKCYASETIRTYNYYNSRVYVYNVTNFNKIDSYYVYGYKSVVIEDKVYYLRRAYSYWRYRNGMWFIVEADTENPDEIDQEYQLHSETCKGLIYDEYRFVVLTTNLLEFVRPGKMKLVDSLILPDILERDYVFDAVACDGRYYWLLEQNTARLFKVDILSYFDQDEDGLSDAAELDAGTSLIDPDTDQDGMQDSFEVKYGLDPLNPADNGTDVDGDGLSNIEEFNLGSDPTKQDTDGDGLTDLEEKELGTNLTAMDTDGDGLIDSADPRPLTPLRYWERIGPYWVVVIAGFVVLVILLKKHHQNNA